MPIYFDEILVSLKKLAWTEIKFKWMRTYLLVSEHVIFFYRSEIAIWVTSPLDWRLRFSSSCVWGLVCRVFSSWYWEATCLFHMIAASHQLIVCPSSASNHHFTTIWNRKNIYCIVWYDFPRIYVWGGSDIIIIGWSKKSTFFRAYLFLPYPLPEANIFYCPPARGHIFYVSLFDF